MATTVRGGLDAYSADAHTLAVYAGHGNRRSLQWGYPHNGRCTIDFSENMRLGAMDGHAAGFGMFLTSCTLHTSSIINSQWLYQQFGYHNSPSIGDNQPRQFFNVTQTKNNKNAWLDEMEDRPGWFTGDNSPIVVSFGSTPSVCSFMHHNTAFKRKANIFDRPETGPVCGGNHPLYYYCYTLRNNGDGPC